MSTALSSPFDIHCSDSLKLRAAYYPRIARKKTGTVCIFQGRSEFIEKYSETITDLRRRGFAVIAFDWRGQGGSQRLLDDTHKCHINNFDLFLRDIEAVFQQIIEPHAPKPWFGLAHSMGATVLMNALERGEQRFERVVFASPMVQLSVIKTPILAKSLANTLNFCGLGKCYVPGGGNTPIGSKPFNNNLLTSDTVRYAQIAGQLADTPEIAVGDPTIGWAASAFHAMDALANPNFGQKLTTPSLIITGGADGLCSSPAAQELAMRLRRCKGIEIAGAKHELLMESDCFRKQFWAAFDAFVPGEVITGEVP